MDDYIEREAAIKAIENDLPEQVRYSREDAADCIRYMDAADVAPVRHGKWIIDNATGKIACSDCGCIYLGYYGGLAPNYCPNCGADMRGGNYE